MSITRAQRARLHDYAPTPDDIDAVLLALDKATDRLSATRAKVSKAEHAATRANARADVCLAQTRHWQGRVKAVKNVLDQAHDNFESPNETDIRRALDAP